MVMKYDDEECYRFHDKDREDRCFICHENGLNLIVVRQIKTMRMVHLCRECMIGNLSDYMLDNTRPWLGDKKK